MKPFHLSFAVPDLKATKDFYLNQLGCELGRDQGNWIDILVFGHQLTIKQESDQLKATPLNHFGPVLDKTDWQSLRQSLEANGVEFLLSPKVINQGQDNEYGKFKIKDPAGNILEFKYYADFENIMAGG